MVPVRSIVKVDLDIVNYDKVLGDFDTVVYLASVNISDEYGASTSKIMLTRDNYTEKIRNNLSGYTDAFLMSVNNYFANGGINLLIINPEQYELNDFIGYIEDARKVNSNFIYVAISSQIIGSVGFSQQVMQSISNYCDNTLSPNKIRLLLTTNSDSYIGEYISTDSLNIVKYCTKTDSQNNLIDSALLVGAYFSKINLDGVDSIADYAYTKEKLIGISGTEINASEDELTVQEFEALINSTTTNGGYYNVINSVGNNVVNFGGNLASTKNIAIHTDFGAIAVERDIAYSVLERMLGKQYLTEQGISNIKAAINAQLQRYKTNGYLNVGAAYSGEDLVITYGNNATKYTVIKHGTTLTQGFYIYSVPMSNITMADRQAKKFTPIYVILETQSGARVVEITGEVR